MIKYVLAAVMLGFLLMPLPALAAGRSETIAAVVNDDAITWSDVNERTRLVMLSSGMPNNAEIRQRLQNQVLNMLVEERLMIQEAARNEIAVTDQEVEGGFAAIAKQNNMDISKFREFLRAQNAPVRAMEHQIRAQVAWSKVIQGKLRPQVSVNDREIDAMLERMRGNGGKTEYMVSEILLPVGGPREEADVRQLAERLTQEMIGGKAPFAKVAAQFSQSSTAARGGDLGWVQEGQLAPDFDELLKQMNEGDLTEPVRTASGYQILLLKKKRIIDATVMPSRDEIMQRIGLERLDRLQRRHLLDLKSEAFIEYRV